MMHTIIIIIVLCVGTKAASSPEIVFENACDLHSSKTSNDSSRYVSASEGSLPEKASPGWLRTSETDIAEWYKIGKAECNAFLISNATSFGKDFPPTYQENKDIRGVQRKCRGKDMLYSLTGVLVWPFGPMKNCSTYNRCWFGLLTCGKPNMEALGNLGKDVTLQTLHLHRPTVVMPPMGDWSIRALRIHLRVIGLEIIVPEQRYLSVASLENAQQREDVLIAQYVITLAHDNYKLEMRHAELYPSALREWSKVDIESYGMEIPGNIYLGGSESRCSGGHCSANNVCCGCDEKSFIVGTPKTVNAECGLDKCPNVKALRRTSENLMTGNKKKNGIHRSDGVRTDEPSTLPLCKASDSTARGRWILSSHSSRLTHACGDDYVSTAFIEIPKGDKLKHLDSINIAHQDAINNKHKRHPDAWFEASGDPCIIKNTDPEDNGEKSWFYAPYECRYHFYTKPELRQCLNAKNISHVHFHGDSMSRDLFLYVARYLGVPSVGEDELKILTNVMKQKNIQTRSENILVSEGYTWDWSKEVMDIVIQQPLPQVVVTNYAIAHSVDTLHQFIRLFEATEKAYWTGLLQSNSSAVGTPKYLIFQNAKSLNGKRHLRPIWSTQNFRRSSHVLMRGLGPLGFRELDEYALTAGRIDNYGNDMDGWHFWGTMRQMEAVVFFNMICNE